eukprot:4938775-Pyramimonas_sp.AAC.1
MNGNFTDLIRPTNGMSPGRGKANHGACALLYHVLEAVHRVTPMARIRQIVDDILVRVEGPEDAVAPAITLAADTL